MVRWSRKVLDDSVGKRLFNMHVGGTRDLRGTAGCQVTAAPQLRGNNLLDSLFFKKNKFIYLFLAASGLHCTGFL